MTQRIGPLSFSGQGRDGSWEWLWGSLWTVSATGYLSGEKVNQILRDPLTENLIPTTKRGGHGGSKIRGLTSACPC